MQPMNVQNPLVTCDPLSVFQWGSINSSTRDHISQIISEEDTKLSILNDEINRLQGRLNDAKDERQKVEGHLTSLHALLAPIRRLPVELFSDVFLLCLDDINGWGHRPSRHDAPLLLAQVDRYWRSIAISTPRLWSSLRLHLEGLKDQTPAGALTELWLQRSGATFLTLDVKIFLSRPTHPVIDAIIPHSHRIKKLKLCLPYELLRSLSHLKGCFPSLQQLDVIGGGNTRAFVIAPALKALALSKSALSTSELDVVNLTYCSLTHLPMHQMLEFLRHTPNLEKLYLWPTRDNEMGPIPFNSTPIVSQLHSLGVQTNGPTLNMLCGSVILPSLRSITVEALDYTSLLWPSLVSFLTRSSSPSDLECFIIEGIHVDERELLRFLAKMQSLTMLGIGCSKAVTRVSDLFLEHLTCSKSNHSTALPKLHSLMFPCVDEAKLVDMIKSRWRPGTSDSGNGTSQVLYQVASLQYVRLLFITPVTQKTRKRLQKLREEGLMIESSSL